MYWDRRAQQTTPSLRNRPLLLSAKGETFWAQSYPSCEMTDVTLYRAKTHPSQGCFNLHWCAQTLNPTVSAHPPPPPTSHTLPT